MNKTTFYIVRHGETEWNTQGLIQGHSDSSLTDKGKEQALAIKEKFAAIHFDAIFSSDLGRAVSTAEIFLERSNLTLNTSSLLRERYFGKYENSHYSLMYEENAELISQMENLSVEDKRRVKFAGETECDEEMCGRIISFILKTSSKLVGKNVLVISHGGIMKGLLAELSYDTYETVHDGRFQNTGYIKLTSDGKKIEIEEVMGFQLRISN